MFINILFIFARFGGEMPKKVFFSPLKRNKFNNSQFSEEISGIKTDILFGYAKNQKIRADSD